MVKVIKVISEGPRGPKGEAGDSNFINISSSFSDRISTFENENILSSSAQIATNISGAFTLTSASLASRVTTLEDSPGGDPVAISGAFTLTSGSLASRIATFENSTVLSSSAQVAVNISGAITSFSSSDSSRVTVVESYVLGKEILSSSAQIAVDISGAFTLTSGSLASRIKTLEDSPGGDPVAISGAFTLTSGSLASRIATFENSTILSSSAQIAVDISGAFTLTSGSLASRIKTLEDSPGGDPVAISGAFTLTSASLAGRVTTLEYYTSSIVTTTHSVTYTFGDEVVYASAISADLPIIIPTAINNRATIYIKKIDSTSNLVIVTGSVLNETIDDGIDARLRFKNEAIILKSDNSNWKIF